METKTPKSIIAAIQTVLPVKVTHPRKLRSISVEDPIGVGIFRRTLNIVTYYKLEGDRGERGWLVAGWIKESLGRALTEQPVIAGRLRRKEDGLLEVVANDSGVRMVEAKFPASLSEFLELVKKDKRRVETETVFWRDIDEDDPNFSPLFYVQVTIFESGGYSIGISCSILIADLLIETDFLRNWSKIQNSLAQTKLKPIFHLPSLKKDHTNILIELFKSISIVDRGEPIVFKTKTCSKISLSCMKKTGISLEKSSTDVFMFIKEQCGGENSIEFDDMKVEIHSSRDEVIKECDCGEDLEKTNANVMSLAFGERFEETSCWFGSISKGVVFVVPSTFGDTKFIVATPKE